MIEELGLDDPLIKKTGHRRKQQAASASARAQARQPSQPRRVSSRRGAAAADPLQEFRLGFDVAYTQALLSHQVALARVARYPRCMCMHVH